MWMPKLKELHRFQGINPLERILKNVKVRYTDLMLISTE